MTQSPDVPHNPFAAPASYGAPTRPAGGSWVPVVQTHRVPQAALASPWLRLGATLLNSVLLIVTLGIGYLIWTMVLWDQGTNPGKKICGLRMVKADTGLPCTFGDMLVRNFVMGALVLSFIGTFTLGIGYLVDALMIFSDRRQRLIDKMSGTLVVQG
jgi:uncharacterized RDD family membrane protein YckC